MQGYLFVVVNHSDHAFHDANEKRLSPHTTLSWAPLTPSLRFACFITLHSRPRSDVRLAARQRSHVVSLTMDIRRWIKG